MDTMVSFRDHWAREAPRRDRRALYRAGPPGGKQIERILERGRRSEGIRRLAAVAAALNPEAA